MGDPHYELLARVRLSIRSLNRALERGSTAADLTVQQQAFLLALSARGGRRVPLAAVRQELGMDQATASDLLARLVRRRLVERGAGPDRRAASLTMTREGRRVFARSVKEIRAALRSADEAGELQALVVNMEDYLRFYGIRRTRARGR